MCQSKVIEMINIECAIGFHMPPDVVFTPKDVQLKVLDLTGKSISSEVVLGVLFKYESVGLLKRYNDGFVRKENCLNI